MNDIPTAPTIHVNFNSPNAATSFALTPGRKVSLAGISIEYDQELFNADGVRFQMVNLRVTCPICAVSEFPWAAR